MPKNLPALFKHIFLLIVIYAFITGGNFLHAQDHSASEEPDRMGAETRWYRSNSAGMALELIPSRSAALRNEFCLSVQQALPMDLPGILIPYYEYQFSIELRILYENGSEIRRQWLLRDSRDRTRLSSSGTAGFFSDIDGNPEKDDSGSSASEENRSGFIEIRDAEGFLTRELRFEEDRSAWDFRYHYRENALFSAETRFRQIPPDSKPIERISEGNDNGFSDEDSEFSDDPAGEALHEEIHETPDGEYGFILVYTDYYRYSRSGSLRAIDRTLHEGMEKMSRIGFPALGMRISSGEDLVTHSVAYTSQFLADIFCPEGTTISYSLDSRGRILREVWKDPDDKVIGEFRNTWDGNRLVTVSWKSSNDERLVEYEYDSSGNRTVERNFKTGALERIVRSRDERDMEEIYMNGNLVLRAIWEKGQKISEEWILPGMRRR